MGEAYGVSRDPSCSQNGDLRDAKHEGANFSHRDLILFFRPQLRDKIRCNRKRLDRITFNKRWAYAASPIARKETMLESSFPPLPAHSNDGPGLSGPHPG